jgi:hypothetical protein
VAAGVPLPLAVPAVIKPPPDVVPLLGTLPPLVDEQDVHGHGESLHLKVHTPFRGPVAHFDGPDPDGDNYAAAIGWGDGYWSDGHVAPSDAGGFDVIGSVTYDAPGTFPITVHLSGADGSQATMSGSATVDAGTTGAVSPPAAQDAPTPAFTPPPPADVPAHPPPADGGATQGPSRPPADTGGIVPWVRLPDALPASSAGGPPRGEPPVALVGPPAPLVWLPAHEDAAPDAAPAEPAYLAADGPVEADPPVLAADLTPIDLRPPPAAVVIAGATGGDDPLAVWSPVPVLAGAPTAESGAGAAPLTCAPPAAPPAEARGGLEAARLGEGGQRKGRPTGPWWRCLSWGAVLIFTERVLACRWADRAVPAARLPRRGPWTRDEMKASG